MEKCYSCKNCGTTIKKTRTYCSVKCQQDFQYKEKIKLWLDGKITGVTESHFVSGYIKKYVLELRGHKCEKCNHSIWMGQPISLSLHHIDGNYRNNNLSNLQLLCCNCHSQTPNYGSKNNGHGRPRYLK